MDDLSRRQTKIPRPGATAGFKPALQPLMEQENIGPAGLQERKRKDLAPVEVQPPAKRAASAAPAQPPVTVPVEDNIWEQIAEETGWSVTDCLSHKLTFPKRADAKAKVEPLVQHVKRLRAAGWHLHDQKERLAFENQALASSLEREETARQEDKEQHEEALRSVQSELGALGQRATRQEAELTERKMQVAQLESAVGSVRESLRVAEQEVSRLEGDRERYKEQVVELQNQTKSMTELYQHAQKYNGQLQEYNGKMQKELQAANETVVRVQAEKAELLGDNASLKGRVTLLEEQVQSMQASTSNTEQARHTALEDATRLRAELAAVIAERNSLSAEAVRLRGELEQCRKEIAQYKEAGSMDASTRSMLESKSRAQAEINSSLQEQVALLGEQKALAEQLAQSKGADVKKLTSKVAQLEADLAAAEQKVQEGELLRRKLHNTIQELKGNIRVFCRVRPASGNEAEEAMPGQPVITFPASGDLVGCGLELSTVQNGKDLQHYSFGFDKVFGPAASQGEVFEEISQLVQSALDGYKCCIFAYGQTGSGKTHTMLGTPSDQGMIPRAMEQIFAAAASLAKQGWQYEMRASMVEVYNEEYKDLLGKGPPPGKKHQVMHDDKGNTTMSYVEAVDVSRPEFVQALLDKAMKQRSVGATAMNEHSSRSHMVFILAIDGANEATGQQSHGVLNLIDLAGSERLAKSGVSGDRLKETQAINKSLSALGDVIAALAGKEQHIPYRNSKLTWLLQNSLGGNSKALMFVNISPSAASAPESLCSLRFAAKVNACEVGTARRNVTAK